mmetsp:Transcript_15025/g.35911  ORF Transcript_15025/g.35911 Transcript_15025/m.35911 type:complete len:214 (-) Transcript_15025:159-800(-)
MRGNNLGHRTHTHGRATNGTEKLAFRSTLVHRSRHEAIQTILSNKVPKAKIFGGLEDKILVGWVVSVGGWREARSKLVIVRTHQRILTSQHGQGKVIHNAHHITDVVRGVKTPGGICNDDESDSQTPHHPNWECHRLHIMSFVGVESTAKAQRGDTSCKVPDHQLTGMPGHRTVGRKAGYVAVLDRERIRQRLGQTRQTAAADDSNYGSITPS